MRKKRSFNLFILIFLACICFFFAVYFFNLYQNKIKSKENKIMLLDEDFKKEILDSEKFKSSEINFNSYKKDFFSKDKRYFLVNEIKSLDFKKDWSLEIPRILKKSEIKKGVDDKTINKYIGHFKGSAYLTGNVCLAAHNRGFDKNYFENLKDINIFDEIKYTVGEKEYKYIVSKKYIVNEYDISVLDDTLNKTLTLITCVNDQPQNRLVVKAEISE